MYAPVVGCRRTLLSASCACCPAGQQQGQGVRQIQPQQLAQSRVATSVPALHVAHYGTRRQASMAAWAQTTAVPRCQNYRTSCYRTEAV